MGCVLTMFLLFREPQVYTLNPEESGQSCEVRFIRVVRSDGVHYTTDIKSDLWTHLYSGGWGMYRLSMGFFPLLSCSYSACPPVTVVRRITIYWSVQCAELVFSTMVECCQGESHNMLMYRNTVRNDNLTGFRNICQHRKLIITQMFPHVIRLTDMWWAFFQFGKCKGRRNCKGFDGI